MKKIAEKKLHLSKIKVAYLSQLDAPSVRALAPTSISCPFNEACHSGIIACESIRICAQ
ncbi:hypothetical protein KTO58_08125 [Chitinophaga pendula]|uniref:hypothetical protein n=1 Tax=Chitinophaga TaxID=79328 RepID=UPI0012FDDEDC|nr:MULTISPECIES: hypothetical protein [Chitinophaga]UCJ09138.1 hypothetical protein KTO58_08125 [Chitinophaga pendula]